jgi:hypothetical protein
MHNLKRYKSPAGYEINSWVRCRTGMLGDQDAVVVEQDINTLQEQAAERAIEPREIVPFVAMAMDESRSILRLYFPE